MNDKMHTGCRCQACRHGITPKLRKRYHKRCRQRHKRELKKLGEIVNPSHSIGYTW